MAAKPLPTAVKDAIITDWRLGQMSIRQIAEKYKVSHGVVGKICKGLDQDIAPIEDAGIQYRKALQQHDGQIVDAVESHVAYVS